MTTSRYVDDHAPTVSDLVRRFQLRRRASTDAFRAGVGLAHTGLVNITDLTADRVNAEVQGGHPLHVELHIDGGSLVGRCPCAAAMHSICRHEVAVAHAVWVSSRRYRRAEEAAGPQDLS